MRHSQGALVELLQHLPIREKVQSTEELFSGRALCQLFAVVLHEEVFVKLPLAIIMEEEDRLSNPRSCFEVLLHSLKQYLEESDRNSKVEINLDRLIYEQSTHELYRLIKYMFRSLQGEQLLINNIRQLTEQSQLALVSVFKQAQYLEAETREFELLNEIEGLEAKLLQEEQRTLRSVEKLNEVQQECGRLNKIIEEKTNELESLHRKVESVEDLQQQLALVSKELELEITKSTQLSSENSILQKNSQILTEHSEERTEALRRELEKKAAQIDKLSNRLVEQLEQSNQTHHIESKYLDIRYALTERCEGLLSRIEQFELTIKHLTDEGVQKDDELCRYREEFVQMEERIRQLSEQREQYLNAETKQTPRYLNATLKDIPHNEPASGVCQNNGCLEKQRTLQSLKQQYSQIISHIRTPNQEYINDCHRIIDEKTKLIEEYQDRLRRSTDENRHLKEKLIGLTNVYPYEEALVKLKQKNTRLKKSVQELLQSSKQQQLVEGKYQELKRMYSAVVTACGRCSTCMKMCGK